MVDSRLVYVCIGAVIGMVISLAVDAIVHHIGIAVSCSENWQSLRDKKSISMSMLHLREGINWQSLEEFNNEYGTSALAVKNWVEKMMTLYEEAYDEQTEEAYDEQTDEQTEEAYDVQTEEAYDVQTEEAYDEQTDEQTEEVYDEQTDEQKHSVPSWFNVIARYRMSKQIAKTLSDIDKQLKSCVPLILLDLQVWQVTQIHTYSQLIGSHLMQESIAEESIAEPLVGFSQSAAGGASGMFAAIKIMFQYKTELASLTELLESIRPIFTEIEQNSCLIVRSKIFRPTTYALNFWMGEMSKLTDPEVEKARVVVPWWNIIRRYKASKQIASLISNIDEHVKLASLINLEPLSQVIHLIECLRQDLRDLPRAPRTQQFAKRNLQRATGTEQTEPQPEGVETSGDKEVETSGDGGDYAPLLGGP